MARATVADQFSTTVPSTEPVIITACLQWSLEVYTRQDGEVERDINLAR